MFRPKLVQFLKTALKTNHTKLIGSRAASRRSLYSERLCQNCTHVRYFRFSPDKSQYKTEVVRIQNNILRHYKPNSFCHNDLHNKNLKKSKKKIFLIDFDHADFGFRAYDLAYYLLHCGHSQTKRFIQDDKYPDFTTLLKVKWLRWLTF